MSNHPGPFYVTLHIDGEAVVWDARAGSPDGYSVRVATGRAFTLAAANCQAGSALTKWVQR